MKLITRTQLGWTESAAPLQTGQRGVKVHYEGTPVPKIDHSKCAGRWTAIRNSHLANTAENYSDVAYNFAVCQHGYVLEGRGIGRRTGANGNQELNRKHYAILVMIGSSGDTQPSPAAIIALREVIQYLREHGAGNEIKGHRDGFATSCPGDALYALVKSGKLEPIINEEETLSLTNEDVQKILNTDGLIPAPDAGTNTHWAWASYVREGYLRSREAAVISDRVEGKLDALLLKVEELEAKISQS